MSILRGFWHLKLLRFLILANFQRVNFAIFTNFERLNFHFWQNLSHNQGLNLRFEFKNCWMLYFWTIFVSFLCQNTSCHFFVCFDGIFIKNQFCKKSFYTWPFNFSYSHENNENLIWRKKSAESESSLFTSVYYKKHYAPETFKMWS